MQQASLLELTLSEPQPIILMPMQLAGLAATRGGSATATADGSASKVGIANATAIAKGGDTVGSSGADFGGAATANASAANGGTAVAQATGGQRGRLCLEARPPQTLARPTEDRPLLKPSAAALAAANRLRARWTCKRNRDFYCDAGRHRKRDRNSDGPQCCDPLCPAVWSKRQLDRYDDKWQCGPGEVLCHWLNWLRGAGPGNRTDQFRKFPIGSIYVHKSRYWDHYSGQCNRTGRWCRFSFQPDHSRAEFFGR